MLQRPELLVEEGFQAGMSMSLDHGASVVGSDLESAVVIADPALLPSHFEVLFQDGQTALRASSGDVVLADGTWLAPGQNFVLADSCSFTAGNTRFALRAPASQAVAVAAPPRKMVSVASGMLAVAALGLLMFTAVGLRAGRATPNAGAHAVQLATNPALRPAAPSAAEVTRQLRGRLDAAGLTAVAVSPARDGSVIAQGLLFPTQMAAWITLRQWYDTQYGSDRVLVDQIVPAGSGPSLSIAAVWAGAAPYVIDDHGDKLFIGASIGGGWSIQAILPNRVVAENGGQKIAIRY